MRKLSRRLLFVGIFLALSLSLRPVLAAEWGPGPTGDYGPAPSSPAPSSPAPPGSDQLASSCADQSALLFCEDFQELTLGPAESPNWSVDVEQGSLAVERASAGDGTDSGEQVLHVRTEENGRGFLVVEDFSAPGNSFFGRVRILVEEHPVAPDFAHYIHVEATSEEPGTERIRPLGGQFIPTDDGGDNRLGIGSDGGPTGDWTDHRESAPALDGVWRCFEWQMDADDNRITVSIDGVPNPDLTVSTRQHGGNDVDFVFPTFDTVKIGWQLFQPGSTPDQFDLLIDDIALSTTPIGC